MKALVCLASHTAAGSSTNPSRVHCRQASRGQVRFNPTLVRRSPVSFSYHWRLNGSDQQPSMTASLLERSAASASPRFSSHNWRIAAASPDRMMLASEPPMHCRRLSCSASLRARLASTGHLADLRRADCFWDGGTASTTTAPGGFCKLHSESAELFGSVRQLSTDYILQYSRTVRTLVLVLLCWRIDSTQFTS